MSSGNTSNNFGPFQFGILILHCPTRPWEVTSQHNPGLRSRTSQCLEVDLFHNHTLSMGLMLELAQVFIPQSSNLFGNSSPLTGGKMYGSNLYYSSSQPTLFQSFIPRTQIPRNNVYGGGSNPYNFERNWNSVPPPKIPFLATLNLPHLSKLINDPIRNSLA